MKKVYFLALALVAVAPVAPAQSEQPDNSIRQESVVYHGGGCRKSSPPGQCCHMERRTGIVHCH